VGGRGSAPDPAGELTALPKPPSSIKGPTSKGEERWREGREGEARGGKGKMVPHFLGESYAPAKLSMY